MLHTYDYPRPALTVDAVIVTREAVPRVLLIQRKGPPFTGAWALPGGFVEENEPLVEAARRELREEAGIDVTEFEQLGTYGDPDRDPRGWTVSVVYMARVHIGQVKPRAGDDAATVAWHSLDALPELAFDHATIIADARRRM